MADVYTDSLVLLQHNHFCPAKKKPKTVFLWHKEPCVPWLEKLGYHCILNEEALSSTDLSIYDVIVILAELNWDEGPLDRFNGIQKYFEVNSRLFNNQIRVILMSYFDKEAIHKKIKMKWKMEILNKIDSLPGDIPTTVESISGDDRAGNYISLCIDKLHWLLNEIRPHNENILDQLHYLETDIEKIKLGCRLDLEPNWKTSIKPTLEEIIHCSNVLAEVNDKQLVYNQNNKHTDEKTIAGLADRIESALSGMKHAQAGEKNIPYLEHLSEMIENLRMALFRLSKITVLIHE